MGEILKACARCGRIHAVGYDCGQRRRYAPRKATTATRVRESSRWKRTAREVKARAFFMCEYCFSTTGKANAEQLEVHHIIPIEEDDGVALEPLNLICLCNNCHRRAERGDISREILRDIARERESGGKFER